ncbi:primary-amine oxidase [Nocardioides guangzhouensis]|uniref:Amine oxidase n=1 Tax=Nocardioides guangzhouensis TaxID=2497878 RepID=A0A4Q4Z4C5_9ACTN|nr:primary-amine oxidase [Nocardioides guangzhouensis]RYP82125.1 primary-amine oxidase [Nocardioides guangzhouensis]
MAMHPLEPLSADEFRKTAAILRRDRGVTDSWRFASIELREPPKQDVKAWQPGDPVGRVSLAVLWNREDNQAYEGVVDLVGDAVLSWTHLPGVCPNFTVDEWHDCDEAMRAHPDVIAALAARGITDMSLLLIDVWTYGKALMPEQWRDRRLGWCDVWRREAPGTNPYAHLVSGIKFIVDMNTMELLQIEEDVDLGSPDVQGEYIPGIWTGEQRSDLTPLHITQPEGVSFTVEGTELRWQNWSMRLGFNYREGPVIYQVAYDDHGEVRDVAYRLSFAEMVVPYRDSSFDHYRRTAYDVGEWGLGYMTTSLELGCDCLGEIVYLDAVLHDSAGEPYDIRNAICLHEEDNAVLWKHVDGTTGAEVRRMRRMVVSCHVTVANYEYLVYWRFYQDGNIECEVRATGIMVTTPYAEGAEAPRTGTVVDNRTYAPFHQHMIVARLDLDVDGADNTVLEVDSEALPVSDANPFGLDLVTNATPVRSESEAARDYRWETQRSWKVVNPTRTNRHGTNTAYKLVPTACFPSMMDPATAQYLRAPVIGHTLWVTRHHDDERWPAGAHPTQSEHDDGMTRWISDDESLENTDVVLWYVFGIHHITRVEDWPIMPADTISFWLKPFGFFDQNPSIDVAPSDTAEGDHCHTGVDDEHGYSHHH